MPPRPTDLLAPAAPTPTRALPSRDASRDGAEARAISGGEDQGGTLALVLAEEAAADPAFAAWLAGGGRSVREVIERLHHDDPTADAVVRGRRRWRALLVEDLAAEGVEAPAHAHDHDHAAAERSVAFAAWCRAWMDDHEPLAVPADHLVGSDHPGWLPFVWPVGLVYKASGLRREVRSVVDLDVAALGVARTEAELAAIVDGVPAPLGFAPARDEDGVLVLRAWGALVDATDGPPAPGSRHERDIVHSLRRCADLVSWLRRLGAAPDRAEAVGGGPRRRPSAVIER